MQTQSDTRAAPVWRRNWFWLLAFMALSVTGCGDPEPETTTPSVDTESKRSANFVSPHPTTPTTSPRWQQPQPPARDLNRFPTYRSDRQAPTGNPWAQPVPGNEPVGGAAPGYQPYTNTPWGQAQPDPQPRTYRYRPLGEKEAREMQQQQRWNDNNWYPDSRTNSPYAETPPDQYPQPVNPWGKNDRWGNYPPARNY